MSVTFSLSGFRELERELEQLANHRLRKASARRALLKAAQPMAAIADALAPEDPASEFDHIRVAVGTRLTRRQRRLHRRMFSDERAAVEVFVGVAGTHPAGVQQEFGNINHGPQSFMRPAWDRDHRAMLDRLKAELAADIQRTVARAARRAARQAARGQ
ncbi:HK97 gp10 family phage protein [Cereibacter sphaeroides]|nr:HK97 gp10 family phage protein [Cereibacter sphaeroides]